MSTSTKLLKERLQRVHVSVGITFSLLMYIAVYFGIFAILLPYIKVWEKPSRHFQIADINNINYSSMVDPVISDPEFPRNNIEIILPGFRGDPALKITHQFVKPVVFNPRTEQKIKDEEDQSQLANFLNGMHYGRPLKTFGYIAFGFIAVAGMFLVIGGVLQIILIKYTNNGKNQQSKFSKWHRKIFTWVFPPFIIITLTGALMNIGFIGSAPMTYISSHGQTLNTSLIVSPVLFPERQSIERKNDTVSMLPINELIKKAKEINPKIDFEKLTLINWKDSSAQVELTGYNPYMPFLNGIYNKPKVILSGVDGHLIKNVKVMDKHWTVLFTDSIYFLHLLFGVDIFTRLFLAFIMGTSTFAIGFGVMLWLEKRARKFERKITFYHWMGKLSLATMIGVIPATGIIFNLQWILPFDMDERFLVQKGIFFISWLSTLTWSFYRINSFKAAKEFLLLGGLLFITAPLCHIIFGGWNPIELYRGGMFSILNVDIFLLAFGSILFFAGIKIPKNRTESKIFWSTKKITKGDKHEK